MKPIQIIATIGPACKEAQIMQDMIVAGMSIARLNFSWGTYAEHRRFVAVMREQAAALDQVVPIIQDLSGPRIQEEAGHTFNKDVTVITEKDRADIAAMADLEIEYVALSFVKDASDISELRGILSEAGSKSKIIAKIERQEALDNLDGIIAAADGVMIARGDLGDAIPIETVPFVKKDILLRCGQAGKPAIVATEMLTSMISSQKPSRADVSDIAHAVLDGACATMLSNETAVGQNPVAAVHVMRKVVDEAQKHTMTQFEVRF